MKFQIFNIPDLHKRKETGLYITSAISQKDTVQPGTDVALPDDAHVQEAREFVQTNKK